jgi:anti-sigma B factor antagonist
MEVHIAHPGTGPALVTMRGQLDMDTVPALQTAFEELAERGLTEVVVDLAELEFCDSIGLSTFVVGHTRCVEQGGWLRLAAPNEFLVRLLSVVGVAEVVPMYATVEGACRDDRTDRVEPWRDPLVA